jgi:TM2 domain-containing membrane protein YozV
MQNITMTTKNHKNKTLSVLICLLFGSLGAHRFYLHGKRDNIAWLHLISLPLSILLSKLYFNLNSFVTYAPWMLSFLISILMCLLLGLKSDEHWDAQFNQDSGQKSASSWPLAILLVFSVGLGAISLLFVMARGFDLLYTGGAYG